ncbi:MAG: glycosyltransferase family 4 protein [Lapillicoccus sp.]
MPTLVRDHHRDPLRIAVIGPSRYPVREPFAGGLEALVWHLVAGLRARGHEVTLFAAEGSDGSDADYGFPSTGWQPSRSASGDISMPETSFMSNHHSHLELLMALCGPLADRFDVIHNHSLHYLPVAMAPLVPVPMLTTLHTPPTPWLESAMLSALGGSSSFAAVSAFVAHQWPGAGSPEVVPNGVDVTSWSEGPGGDDLVWSGRIVPEKAPHLAVEAAALARRPLVLAGPVTDTAYFDARIRPALGPDVTYAGHLSSHDLARLIGSSAAALVTPVWDEPFGLVVAEALACGTPVVAFRRGGIPEIISSRSLGELVVPGNTELMAAAVTRVARLNRGEIREYAVAHLSRTSMVTSYEALYESLIAGASAEDSLLA